MATLKNLGTGNEICLRARTSVGRTKHAEIRLLAESASKEHATIHWDGEGWILHDRSRNGTRVNGRLLQGQPLRLDERDQLTFGDPNEIWQLTDASAPEASALRSDGHSVRAQGGVLLLPDEEQPLASLYCREGHWELDVNGQVTAVQDEQIIRLGEFDYQLDLPTFGRALDRTVTVVQDRSLQNALIRFEVSADEEHVAVWLEIDRTCHKLPDRALNYMLLLLARSRQGDSQRGVAAADAGWVYCDDLSKQLDLSMERLNVDVHRVRRAVGRLKLGSGALFADPDRIIERRRTTTQLRLGVPNIQL